ALTRTLGRTGKAERRTGSPRHARRRDRRLGAARPLQGTRSQSEPLADHDPETVPTVVPLEDLARQADRGRHTRRRERVARRREGRAANRRFYQFHVSAFYKWPSARVRPQGPTATIPRPRAKAGAPRPIGTNDLDFAIRTADPRVRALVRP